MAINLEFRDKTRSVVKLCNWILCHTALFILYSIIWANFHYPLHRKF
jgi:hypothetical protein